MDDEAIKDVRANLPEAPADASSIGDLDDRDGVKSTAVIKSGVDAPVTAFAVETAANVYGLAWDTEEHRWKVIENEGKEVEVVMESLIDWQATH